MKKAIVVSKALLFLLLSLPGLVVLEPVKDVFALDVPKIPKPCSDVLNLLSSWSSQTLLVQALKHVYLLLGWVPSRPSISKSLITTLHCSFPTPKNFKKSENGMWILESIYIYRDDLQVCMAYSCVPIL